MTGAAALSDPDLLLVAQAQRGDRDAFERLVRRHWDSLVGFLYRMCGDVSIAEDAAQTACLNAWLRLASFRPEGSLKPESAFRAWLYRIGMNAALDVLRRERPAKPLDALPAGRFNPVEASAEAAYIAQERGERVRQAVLSLPPAARAVLVMREYEGLTYQEIAAALEIPVGTVMSRLSYARTWLAERLRVEIEGI
jgi:RNA polymerase sigma-70 factor (ECF subfamily)